MTELIIVAVIVIGSIGAMIVAFGAGQKSGRTSTERDQAAKEVDHAKQSNQTLEDVRRLTDDELYRELRGHK